MELIIPILNINQIDFETFKNTISNLIK